MVEDCIVRGLISQDCRGLWNTVRRLVETDSHQRLGVRVIQFNIIYIMRTVTAWLLELDGCCQQQQ
ncbi:hypothetical protein ALQ42_200038 [Pseudomonas savastanoi pv. glycinea]|uniref:Uncharacterized protein n=1 Tax=Pseudomonas savastanoi pv. glycinea TaxID=318 RepID=A0A3M3U5K7_PSESG|nr:hypothetical protein ALQ42_200038 [Pseudomonas savastanoi pv. glycinea]